MKSISPLISVMLMTLPVSGEDHERDNRVNVAASAFVAELEDTKLECYLVVVYDARAGQNPIKKPQIDFKATIVGVVRGRRQVGDKIEYDRVSDGGYGNPQEYEGLMYYVFYRKMDVEGSPIFGQYYIDSQDPLALFPYSLERAKFASKVNRKEEAEQVGTGQPATRPQSKSEGSQKPKPESERRPR